MGVFVKKITIFFILLTWDLTVFAKENFTYLAPNGINDTRHVYAKELLALALKLTESEYGEFELSPSTPNIDLKQSENLAIKGEFKNFFFKLSYNDELANSLLAIPIPLERGIVGYRISFISSKTPDILKYASSIQDFRTKTVVQGIGWLDSNILSTNGLSVFSISSYDKMFDMVANQRVELLFRGVNEWLNEFNIFKSIYPELTYDKHIALHYPLPRFFFTSKDNKLNAERVKKGLLLAMENGSFQRLWLQHYASSVKASRLSQRHIIELENPYIKALPSDYQKYNISMQELKQIEQANYSPPPQ
ncbi:hypothetical protein N7931_13875 [Catenovulum sp. 2E275]|uniref:hypothetical protein n=1 Tax=Catenovulum sp. 2E275 TaxID=2980497 RepID=UPI0021D3546E|nr:hypothetical protein [Catenovulum sp. 2E275]MCU4676720.1 hypothetical protein [Catenovulum sp. 2E275]